MLKITIGRKETFKHTYYALTKHKLFKNLIYRWFNLRAITQIFTLGSNKEKLCKFPMLVKHHNNMNIASNFKSYTAHNWSNKLWQS